MSDLPKKLRHFAAMRKQLGGHPVGYEYFIEAAEEIEQLRKTVKNLQFHNRGLQAVASEDNKPLPPPSVMIKECKS